MGLLELLEQRRLAQQQPLVPEELHLAQRAADRRLELGRHALLDLLLGAAQHERPEQLRRVRELLVVHLRALGRVELEGRVEGGGGGEEVRVEEVEQRPQLVQVVLQRRAREQQRVREVEAADGLRDLRGVVLDHVALVDDQVAPPRAVGELRLHGGRLGHLERGDDDVDVGRALAERLHEALALLQVARVQLDGAQLRAEALELGHPRGEHRERRDDQVRPADALDELEVGEEGDGLQRLAQAHLVREDGIDAAPVHAHQPAQPAQLVVTHRHQDLGGRHDRLVLGEAACGASASASVAPRTRQIGSKVREDLTVRLQEAQPRLRLRHLGGFHLVVAPQALQLLLGLLAWCHRLLPLWRQCCAWLFAITVGKGGVGERPTSRELTIPHGTLALLHANERARTTPSTLGKKAPSFKALVAHLHRVEILPLHRLAIDHDGRATHFALAIDDEVIGIRHAAASEGGRGGDQRRSACGGSSASES